MEITFNKMLLYNGIKPITMGLLITTVSMCVLLFSESLIFVYTDSALFISDYVRFPLFALGVYITVRMSRGSGMLNSFIVLSIDSFIMLSLYHFFAARHEGYVSIVNLVFSLETVFKSVFIITFCSFRGNGKAPFSR